MSLASRYNFRGKHFRIYVTWSVAAPHWAAFRPLSTLFSGPLSELRFRWLSWGFRWVVLKSMLRSAHMAHNWVTTWSETFAMRTLSSDGQQSGKEGGSGWLGGWVAEWCCRWIAALVGSWCRAFEFVMRLHTQSEGERTRTRTRTTTTTTTRTRTRNTCLPNEMCLSVYLFASHFSVPASAGDGSKATVNCGHN